MTASSDSVLDPDAVERLRDSVGEEFLGELVSTFLDDAPGQLTTLRGAFECGDAEEARRAAHTLRSSGATFGAEGFSQLTRELEERAKASNLAGTDELIGRAEAEYARVEAALTPLRRGGCRWRARRSWLRKNAVDCFRQTAGTALSDRTGRQRETIGAGVGEQGPRNNCGVARRG